jgi:hypothetical protein
VADFLQQHRVTKHADQLVKSGERTGEVGVAIVLNCLFHRIRMYCKGIGSDPGRVRVQQSRSIPVKVADS